MEGMRLTIPLSKRPLFSHMLTVCGQGGGTNVARGLWCPSWLITEVPSQVQYFSAPMKVQKRLGRRELLGGLALFARCARPLTTDLLEMLEQDSDLLGHRFASWRSGHRLKRDRTLLLVDRGYDVLLASLSRWSRGS